MRFFPMVVSAVLAVAAFNVYAAPGVTAPRLDLLSYGLNPAVAVNYFYEEPKGECEKNTLCDWEIGKDDKNWSSFKTGNSRYLPLTVNEREQWLRVKITPKSAVNETGTGRESVAGNLVRNLKTQTRVEMELG